MTDAVEVLDLKHSYGDRQALAGVSFNAPKGGIFGLLGPNGGGKTTMFKILSTALRPTAGDARIEGKSVLEEPGAVRQRIGVVFQAPSLDKKLRVIENLTHQGHLYGLCGAELKKRCEELLQRVGLADRKREIVENLSGGLKRRAELAKGLLHRPQVLLLDEPSTGLDPGGRKDMWDYLKILQKESGVTILLTTHLMEEAEKCDLLGILNQGALVAFGTPGELRQEVGGDVLSIETRNAPALSRKIAEKFGDQPQVVDGHVRLERAEGHRFLTELIEAFPGEIEAVHLGKPTLEDVFIRRTGHAFWAAEEGS